MAAPILDQRDLDFLLYEVFDAESLTKRDRYTEHNRETFDAAMTIARQVAEKYFLPIRSKADTNQPMFENGVVTMIPEIKVGLDAVIDSGLASARADFDIGGMQLPEIVASCSDAWLSAAASTTLAYASLTTANANLIDAYGTEAQKSKWVRPMREGRFAGTMAMSEPNAGSGLADLTSSAQINDDGSYRVVGNKIWISGGDHELNENIVHLVLARVKGAPQGIKGISLFIVPKFLVNDDGSLGERNDVALAGLFHKMGGRGQTSTALNFGENEGAIGYLVGEENKGLMYMFHMMNEARILVGFSGAINALAGYRYALDYAKERPQGRLPSCKDPLTPPINIIEHADVKRMLLAQKSYAEGGFALCMFGSQLADDIKTAESQERRDYASLLLDTLIPIIKTWPSEYGCKANSMAIQVLGGAGYVNEHPVEMFFRDNRLNPIHEGTTGIQSIDLLGRKTQIKNGAGLKAVLTEMRETIDHARQSERLSGFAEQLEQACVLLTSTTQLLSAAMAEKNIDLALSNSVKYLEVFGNVVIAWTWLKLGLVAEAGLARVAEEADQGSSPDSDFYQGKLQALQYFYRFELPEIYPWAALLSDLDDTCYTMQKEWF
ncbi:MAG: acyl-CoA dehydrogenase [Pseudomonadales bacterium]|nr:acyl-CoA dehydrogenase [Pseudomonadales bacterium]